MKKFLGAEKEMKQSLLGTEPMKPKYAVDRSFSEPVFPASSGPLSPYQAQPPFPSVPALGPGVKVSTKKARYKVICRFDCQGGEADWLGSSLKGVQSFLGHFASCLGGRVLAWCEF